MIRKWCGEKKANVPLRNTRTIRMDTREKTRRRLQRKRRIRARVHGTAQRPRLAVFRSNTRIVAQLIDDDAHTTLASVSTAQHRGDTMRERSVAAGAALAQAANAKGIQAAVFDRGGYRYTGNIKAFADAAREAGLAF